MRIISRLKLQINKNQLTFRLLFYVIIISFALAIIITAVQVYMDYQNDIDVINKNIQFINDSYLPSISTSVYKVDKEQIELLMNAALKLQDIVYLTIIKLRGDSEFIYAHGNPDIKADLIMRFPLEYKLSEEHIFNIGELEVSASYHDVLIRIGRKIVFIMFLNMIYLFIISLSIFLIIQNLISKHLSTMALYTQKIDLYSLDEDLVLIRKKRRFFKNDELDKVVESINDMRLRIKDNILEQNKIKKELVKAQSFLNNIIESMPSILFSVDNNGMITHWNKAANDLWNVKTEHAIGKHFSEIGLDFSKYKSILENIKKNKSPVFLHRELIKSIDSKYFNVSLYPLVANGIEGTVIRLDDITDLEKLQKQLLQNQKMETLVMLAGGLAHDFNNILVGIITSVSIIKSDLENNDFSKIKKYVDIIDRSGERAASIVAQLLTISREKPLEFKNIDLNKSIKDVVVICNNSFDKSIIITTTYLSEPAITYADISQIEQVILNLCINASHAMTIMVGEDKKKGGSLNIDLEKIMLDKLSVNIHPDAEEQEYFVVKIKDTGVGMDKDTLGKIFVPFFTTKEKNKGTGLGLAMAYNIIKQHKGFITVYSEINKGTVFIIYFPVSNKVQKYILPDKNKKPIELSLSNNDKLILIIDDEKTVRELVIEILEKRGYKTIFAENGKQGLEMFKKRYQDIDAVILDMSMPVMSGKEVFLEMIKIKPDIKTIMVSGFGQDDRVVETMKLGISSFYTKTIWNEKSSKNIKRDIG